MKIKTKIEYLRSFTFGVEDSLVSTVGLLSGVAAAGMDRQEIVLTGVILIFVEAFSMGVGDLLSMHSAEEFEEGKDMPFLESFKSGLVMFFSYLLSGLVPLLPYVFLSKESAFVWSIILSLFGLLLLGMFNGRLIKKNIIKHGIQMLVIGGLAVLVGIAVGSLVK